MSDCHNMSLEQQANQICDTYMVEAEYDVSVAFIRLSQAYAVLKLIHQPKEDNNHD